MNENEPILERSRKAKLRMMGLAPKVFADAGPVKSHAIMLHERGMSLRQIAEKGGTAESTLSELLSGTRNGKPHSGLIRVEIAQRVLAVEWETPDDRGARMLATGAHRRIGALRVAGYNYQFMSIYLGRWCTSRSYISTLMTNTWTHHTVHTEIDAMYKKLRDVDPCDMGISVHSKRRSATTARNEGMAPAHCWDDDEIDLEDSLPEWTGACGSMRGVRLHRKHSIMPLCERCMAAQREDIAKLKREY